MTKGEEEKMKKEKEVSALEGEAIKIDLAELYKFEPKDLIPDISVVHYSNLAYIQATFRDIYIDFLEMPGIKKDGKVLVNGTRIYMSFVAAQKLSETLHGILEEIHSKGKVEIYRGKDELKEKKLKDLFPDEDLSDLSDIDIKEIRAIEFPKSGGIRVIKKTDPGQDYYDHIP